MRGQQREVYRILATEINGGLGSFCKYAEWSGTKSCEGGVAEMVGCRHPLDWRDVFPECCVEPGVDCWGFRPCLSLPDIADVVGIVLSERYHEWVWWEEDNKILVFGRKRQTSSTDPMIK